MIPVRTAIQRTLSCLGVVALVIVAVALTASKMLGGQDSPKLHIIQDSLIQQENFYGVKGSIYNPYDRGVKNVVIRYYIWKKWMGQEDHGSRIKETGGLVTATIKYLPPKGTVEFVATGGDNAPVMINGAPDPIDAVISAEWDE